MNIVLQVKSTPWGKFLQISWGKLLHCILSYMGYEIGLKCCKKKMISLFIKFYPEIHYIYPLLRDKKVQMVSFITAVEINVHNFINI